MNTTNSKRIDDIQGKFVAKYLQLSRIMLMTKFCQKQINPLTGSPTTQPPYQIDPCMQKFNQVYFNFLQGFIALGDNKQSFYMQQKNKKRKEVEALQTLKVVDGKYIIKNHILGTGSFATSYLCIVDNVQEVLACKMISKKDLITKINSSINKALTKDYLVNALKNEVNTWKKLKHKNIVSFYDFSETASNIYFFLQFCQDGNLETKIKKGRLKQQQAIPLFRQMADGCEYLYDRGILHRDLKPQNILLHNGNIKIADFGFAKVIEDQLKDNPQQNTLVGTPTFMAPQVLSGQPYNIKCDVWSLGVLFYKCLYGFLPWQNTQNYSILLQYINNGVTFSPNIKLSDGMKNLLKKMLTNAQLQRISIKQVRTQIYKIGDMDIE